LVLTVLLSADWVRYTRASMLDTLPEDYLRTARAKGADAETIVWRHAFRNALVPLVTLFGLSLPLLFSGTLVVETLFNWPGMRTLEYDSILQRDYNVAMVALLFIAATTMLCNLLADLLYALVDPRIRVSGERRI